MSYRKYCMSSLEMFLSRFLTANFVKCGMETSGFVAIALSC